MKQNVHTTAKHPRGSSPPDNVEQIYRAWLQRLPLAPEGPKPEKPATDQTDNTGSDAHGTAGAKNGHADPPAGG